MSSGTTATRNLLVGVAFLGSLAVLGVATLSVTSLPFLTQAEAVEVWFPNVDNLQVGDDVVVHGLRVGQVEDIRYDPAAHPEAPIRVECSIPVDVKTRLQGKGEFVIHSAGPLGGRYIEITPPAAGDPAEAPPFLVGEAPGDVFQQIESIVEPIRTIAEDIESGRGLLGRVIQDPVLSADFAQFVAEIEEVFRKINEGEGLLGALVTDQDLRDRVSKGLADAADVIADLREEKGIVGYLLNNEEGKEELKAAVTDLRDLLRSVKEGDGVASRLLNDPELADNLEEIVQDFHEIVHKANTGHGTLGQVINNRKAWDELVRALVLARETIEDLREQAPVSTFVNVLFAAF